MSPTRFFKTVVYQLGLLTEKERGALRRSINIDESVSFTSRMDYAIYSTINILAKEVLIKEELLREQDFFSPLCTVKKDTIEWTDSLKDKQCKSYQECFVFNYTYPFKATFLYVNYRMNEYHTDTYKSIINSFTTDVIKTFNIEQKLSN